MAGSVNAVDFFTTLPLELSQRISQYLPIHQVFQARRVSRRWNAILSTSYVVESTCLRPWYNGEELPLRIPGNLSEDAVMSLKAEHVDAFRNGRPFSVAVSSTEKWIKDISYDSVGYAKGILAWLTTDGQSIRLKCLASGKSETLASPDGTNFQGIVFYSCVLVASTSLKSLYVWTLLDGFQRIEMLEPTFVGLEPFYLWVLVSDSRLAIVHEDREKIYLKTIENRTRTTYDLELELRGLRPPLETSDDFKVMDASGGNSLVYFERVMGSPSYVYFTRVDRHGKLESKGHVKHPNIEGYTSHYEEASVSLPMDGSVILWSYTRHLPSPMGHGPDAWLLLRICYVQDQLRVEQQTISHIVNTPRKPIIELFRWKDVIYHLDEQAKLEIIDLKESTCKPTEMSVPTPCEEHNALSSPNTASSWLLLGDESFLIGIRGGSCVVWCFDRHLASAIPHHDESLCY